MLIMYFPNPDCLISKRETKSFHYFCCNILYSKVRYGIDICFPKILSHTLCRLIWNFLALVKEWMRFRDQSRKKEHSVGKTKSNESSRKDKWWQFWGYQNKQDFMDILFIESAQHINKEKQWVNRGKAVYSAFISSSTCTVHISPSFQHSLCASKAPPWLSVWEQRLMF